MGVVVAARHVHLRERVAIKLIADRTDAPGDLVTRILREGRAAMRIRSEHVVRVFDVGTLESGAPFLVMEHLQGSDLAAVVAREGPLPVEAAVEYVLQAIEALAEAHALGIVHRDLKPANLFLARRADGSPIVKVLDFGIAKSTGADASVTESNGPVGTPAYMAPEQMRTHATLDARTDVWGLGVTLYALLSGAPPFEGGSMLEIHESISRGARPLRAVRADAPEAIEAVVARCMRPDPAERYATVAEVAAALAEHAPEHARVSAQRAARILSAATQAAVASRAEDAETLGSAGEGTRPAAEPSWDDAARGGATTGSRTGASPPVVTAATSRGRPTWQRVLALAGAAGVGGVVALAALGPRAPATVPHAAGAHVEPPAAVPAAAPDHATAPASAAPSPVSSAPPPSPSEQVPAVPKTSPGKRPSLPSRPQPSPSAATTSAPPQPPAPPVRARDPLADPN